MVYPKIGSHNSKYSLVLFTREFPLIFLLQGNLQIGVRGSLAKLDIVFFNDILQCCTVNTSERPNHLKLSSAEPRSFGQIHRSFGRSFGRIFAKKRVRITQKWRIFHQKFDKPNRAYICAIY